MPTRAVGKIGSRPRAVWAGTGRFFTHVRGTPTHAGYPHRGVDPIVTSAHLITALQTVASRTIDTQDACVFSVAQIHAGNQFNVIPQEVVLEGVLRTLSDDVRDRAVARVEAIVEHTARAFGAHAEVSFHRGAFAVVNDAPLLERTLDALRNVAPERLTAIAPQMGAEDFSAFSRQIPSVYMLLGVRNEARGIVHGLHSPHFDVDEASIPVGVEAMAATLAQLTTG